ncbi:MAG: phosphoribosylglycinamide formyltransferase [Rhodoferax sp.]|nr:phosphoribosylglycinamide formyltransferase [Rhodoferax sp.]
MQTAPQPIVILISGGGSNMAAIVRAAQKEGWAAQYGAQVAAVISNKPGAGGLHLAREQGIETQVLDHHTFPSRGAFDQALAAAISGYDQPGRPALVVLAGFMRILTPDFVARHAGRLLNIHPSLLPAFAGLHTHQRAIDAGCKYAGATVHQVTAELDAGAILEQSIVPVLLGDTEQTLAARVLATEHVIYPRAIRAWLRAQAGQTVAGA